MAEEKKESETVKTPEEVVKEFKTRKDKKTEEYESSFEREAVKALENDNLEKQYETDEELSSIKSDSDMQTAVPKLKKKYHPQKGMPVKIVIEDVYKRQTHNCVVKRTSRHCVGKSFIVIMEERIRVP